MFDFAEVSIEETRMKQFFDNICQIVTGATMSNEMLFRESSLPAIIIEICPATETFENITLSNVNVCLTKYLRSQISITNI